MRHRKSVTMNPTHPIGTLIQWQDFIRLLHRECAMTWEVYFDLASAEELLAVRLM